MSQDALHCGSECISAQGHGQVPCLLYQFSGVLWNIELPQASLRHPALWGEDGLLIRCWDCSLFSLRESLLNRARCCPKFKVAKLVPPISKEFLPGLFFFKVTCQISLHLGLYHFPIQVNVKTPINFNSAGSDLYVLTKTQNLPFFAAYLNSGFNCWLLGN